MKYGVWREKREGGAWRYTTTGGVTCIDASWYGLILASWQKVKEYVFGRGGSYCTKGRAGYRRVGTRCIIDRARFACSKRKVITNKKELLFCRSRMQPKTLDRLEKASLIYECDQS